MDTKYSVNSTIDLPTGDDGRLNDTAKPLGAKRAYQPPCVLSREPLEAIAVVCSSGGRANAMDCPSGPINS